MLVPEEVKCPLTTYLHAWSFHSESQVMPVGPIKGDEMSAEVR